MGATINQNFLFSKFQDPMYDDFYSALERGRIEPITLWKDKVSKWTWEEQTRLEIELIGKVAKEEREGRYGSDLHRYAMQLANYISQQSNFQRQKEQELQTLSTDADERELPEILKHPEIRTDFDKAIRMGLLMNYYTLNPDKKKASNELLACFCWGICKQYDKGAISKSGEDKGGFAADWNQFSFIKDKNGKEIDLKQGWQNAKRRKHYPQKLCGFAFWETLCNKLDNNK